MIEFPLHTLETVPASSRAVLKDGGMANGHMPKMIRTIAESPTALTGFAHLRRTFSESSLTALEQQVVYMTVSKANACHYCMTQIDGNSSKALLNG